MNKEFNVLTTKTPMWLYVQIRDHTVVDALKYALIQLGRDKEVRPTFSFSICCTNECRLQADTSRVYWWVNRYY